MGQLTHWANDDNWKNVALITYLFICIFDFVLVPSWVGLFRDDIGLIMELMPWESGSAVQLEYLKLITSQHEPFTLRGGGLFHLSFGAILTGSAFAPKRSPLQTKPNVS